MQTASGWTIRGRVNEYVPIPEIIDRVKLVDVLVLVRVYMRIRLIHILRSIIDISINRLLKNITFCNINISFNDFFFYLFRSIFINFLEMETSVRGLSPNEINCLRRSFSFLAN